MSEQRERSERNETPARPFRFESDPRVTPPSQAYSFTAEQEALIEHIAFKVGEVLDGRMREYIDTSVKVHKLECSLGKDVEAVSKKVDTIVAGAQGGWKVLATAGATAVGASGILLAIVEVVKHLK